MSFGTNKGSTRELDRKYGINKNRRVGHSLNKFWYETASRSQLFIERQVEAPITNKPLPELSAQIPKLIEIPVAVDQQVQNPESPLDLQHLESKIDSILQRKMKILVKFNKQRFFNKQRCLKDTDDQLGVQMSKLTRQLKHLVNWIKTNMDDIKGETDSQKWEELDKKSRIIQKVLAQNSSEIDIMKKYYAKVSSTRTSYKGFCNDNTRLKTDTVQRIKQFLFKPKSRNSNSFSDMRLPWTSNQKDSYKVPNLENYQKYRHCPSEPDMTNPFIVQKSAYTSSYTKYSSHHVMPSKDHRYSSMSFNPHSKPTRSTYKDQFRKVKEEKATNYKQLDCYRDKFRQLNIKYDWRPEALSLQMAKEYILLQRVPRRTQSQARRVQIPTQKVHTKDQCQTKECRQQPMRVSRPKNNRLESLKYSFRKLIP